MTEIPDSLRSVFTGRVEQNGSEYIVSIPNGEVENDGVTPGETYRIAVLETASSGGEQSMNRPPVRPFTRDSPPVEEDELIEVEIESIGDEGDGIAKVDRGYVIIVPDGQPGDVLTVRIEEVKENVAFAEIHH